MVTKYSIVDCMQRLQKSGFSDEQVYALAKGFEELQSILKDEIKLQVRNKAFHSIDERSEQ